MSAFLYVCPGFYFICLFSIEREEKKGCGFGWVGRIWEGLEEGNHDQTTLYGENVFSKGIFRGSSAYSCFLPDALEEHSKKEEPHHQAHKKFKPLFPGSSGVLFLVFETESH